MIFVILTILVPLFALAIIHIADSEWNFRNKEEAIKALQFLGISVIVCVILNVGLYFGATSKARFNEVWNFKAVSIKHQERYSREETRSREVPCGTYKDSQGNTHTKYCTEYYDVTEYYGPYFTMRDETGRNHNISEKTYREWAGIWGNEQHVGTIEGTCDFGDVCMDGKTFQATWPNTFDTIFPYSEIHTYVNKVRVSDGVFKYEEPSEEAKVRFIHPVEQRNRNGIHTYGPNISGDDQMLFYRLNAELGRTYQIHNLVLLFDANKDSNKVVHDVLSAWKGPNKNELVIFIGLNGDKIEWCEVESWMDDTTLHASLGRKIRSMKVVNREEIANLIRSDVKKYWNRKEFSDFDYIKIQIHIGYIIASFVIMSGVCLATYLIFDKKLYPERSRRYLNYFC